MSKSGARVLVVDDELEILRALQRNLTVHGYNVFTTRSGEEAIKLTKQLKPDLILLDLMLPDISGLNVCQRVRKVSNVPIIVLSIKNTEHDKVQALDLGADDYVPKPFGIDEVLARIRVALRHAALLQSGAEPRLQLGPLDVDFASRCVRVNEQPVQLTPTEYDLLKIFIAHRGKILTRRMLLAQVWGADMQDKERLHSLHVYVAQLRRKIEPDPNQPRFILTIPGVGYRFSNDEDIANTTSEIMSES